MLKNIRCFARAEIPLDAQITIILGLNGSGKTTIAESIASLARGENEGLHDFPLRRGASTAALTLFDANGKPLARWQKGPTEHEEERTQLPPGNHVFTYGQYRALRPPVRRRPRSHDPRVLGDPTWNASLDLPVPDNLEDALRRPAGRTLFDFDEYLFRDLSAYAALLEERSSYDLAARTAWERLRAWLRGLDARIDDVAIVKQKERRFVAFRRGDLTLPITDLSDGYRAALAVVLDLVIRYTLHFPTLEDPLAGAAIVVIDEVDLNLHPRWQRLVTGQLTSLFPATRFVLTTHSPEVVQAAIDDKEHHVRILVLDEKPGAGTTVRELTKREIAALDGAEVDSVLVDGAVFNLPSRLSPTYEISHENRARDLRKKVEKGTETESERKELLRVLDELQGLMAREEEREGNGPLMSEIARSQLAFLTNIEEATAKKKGGKRSDSTSAKRPQRTR
ncbi:MAG: AAA family ATPase [Byssovorax sp.]